MNRYGQCPRCGSPAVGDSRFCLECGADLAYEVTNEERIGVAANTTGAALVARGVGSSSPIVRILITILAFAVAFGIGYFIIPKDVSPGKDLGAMGTGDATVASVSADSADTGVHHGVEAYEPYLQGMRMSLKSGDQLTWFMDDWVWGAEFESVKDEIAYAFHDLNGDGNDELLVGIVKDGDHSAQRLGTRVGYELLDLFTMDDGQFNRVLSINEMSSLGYRAYCVPCEGNCLAVGGSSGALQDHVSLWRFGKLAGDRELVASIDVDDDTYTFTDGDGRVEVLSGDKGKARYEELIAQFTPKTGFNWQEF